MVVQAERREQALANLREVVDEAVLFWELVDADLFDGYQTAREVLEHLVFWQCEHLSVAQALAENRAPALKQGSLAELSRCGCSELHGQAVVDLLDCLQTQGVALDRALRDLPDWDVDFPIKAGCRVCTVEDRVYALGSYIYNHMVALRRVAVRSRIRAEGLHPLAF